jgi:hypothetical protein
MNAWVLEADVGTSRGTGKSWNPSEQTTPRRKLSQRLLIKIKINKNLPPASNPIPQYLV